MSGYARVRHKSLWLHTRGASLLMPYGGIQQNRTENDVGLYFMQNRSQSKWSRVLRVPVRAVLLSCASRDGGAAGDHSDAIRLPRLALAPNVHLIIGEYALRANRVYYLDRQFQSSRLCIL